MLAPQYLAQRLIQSRNSLDICQINDKCPRGGVRVVEKSLRREEQDRGDNWKMKDNAWTQSRNFEVNFVPHEFLARYR